MEVLDKIFKANDIRGVYPSELNEEIAFKAGKAFRKVRGKGKIVVSADLRPSSPTLKSALLQGLSQGGKVLDVGFGTSPFLYFAVCRERAIGGAMITASHIPLPYNGIKFTQELAKPFGKEQGLEKIKELVSKDEEKFSFKEEFLEKVELKELTESYLNFLISNLNPDLVPEFANLKVVVDPGNGMVGLFVPKLFSVLGIKGIFVNLEPDFTFPNHIADPSLPETLKELKAKVIKEKANLGLAFDGDGDRLGVIDDKGNLVPSYVIGSLIAENLILEGKTKKFVKDLTVSKVFEEVIKRKGGESFTSRVGHSFVKAKMETLNAGFAMESSGHFAFQFKFGEKVAFFDDALFAAFKLIESLLKKNKPLSELSREYIKYAYSEILTFKVSSRAEVLERVKKNFLIPEYKVSFLDGIKVESKDWWFVVRPSNTEEVIRVVVEAQDETTKDQILNKLKALINA